MNKFSFANTYNKVTFSIDTTDFAFASLEQLYKEDPAAVHQIDGLYISTAGKFGDAPVFINVARRALVNVPAHMLDTCRDILGDLDAIEAIKAGAVGFTVYTYESHNRTCYSVNFVDIVD